MSTLLDELFPVFWVQTLTELLDSEAWRRLANDPERCERELNNVLERLGKIRRYQSGLPVRKPHRPIENSRRDEKIVYLRAVKGLTFGQIAKQLGITPNQAGLAYKRFVEKVQQDLREILELLLTIRIECSRSKGLSPSSSTSSTRHLSCQVFRGEILRHVSGRRFVVLLLVATVVTLET